MYNYLMSQILIYVCLLACNIVLLQIGNGRSYTEISDDDTKRSPKHKDLISNKQVIKS